MGHEQESTISKGFKLGIKFFKEEKKFFAISGLITLIGFELFHVYLLVRFNQWYSTFYNTLQNLDKSGFKKQLLVFAVLALIYVANALIKITIRLWYSLEWRNWMTNHYLNKWTKNNTYYTSKIFDQEVDNPDQRISQDIKEFSDFTIDLFLGFLTAVTTLVSFVVILWGVSGVFKINIFQYHFNIHGYFVWIALIYALLGTYFTHKIGRPLSDLLFKQEKKEADFRYQLVRLRENAESTAMYNAIDFEKDGMLEKFKKILSNTKHIIFRQMKITTFVSFYEQIAIILPILVASPKYFLKQITLGGLMQISNAFGEVKTALSWLITSYTTIANLRAVIERLDGFDKSLALSYELAKKTELRFLNDKNNILIKDLEVSLPSNELLFNCKNLTLDKSSYLIMGKSGVGKSSLFKTLRGLWPFTEGEVYFPQNAKVMFVPQKIYMPLGELKKAIAYPKIKDICNDTIIELLKKFDLKHLIEKLSTVDEWSRVLSSGEQQKLAILRCILNKPDIVFLDEATSALDVINEKIVYETLKENLKGLTIISIAHKDTLKRFHESILVLQDGKLKYI